MNSDFEKPMGSVKYLPTQKRWGFETPIYLLIPMRLDSGKQKDLLISKLMSHLEKEKLTGLKKYFLKLKQKCF